MDLQVLVSVLLVALCALYLAMLVVAVVQIVVSHYDVAWKVVWMAIIVVAPFLGSLAWFVLGRPEGLRRGLS